MKRVILAMVLASCAIAGAEQDVTGSWAMEIHDPLRITNRVPLELKQDGENLTGKASDTPLTLFFEDTVGALHMEGSVVFGRYASGTWTATKQE